MMGVIKKLILLIILAINILCFGNTVLERKVIIPKGGFDSYYVHPLNIFLLKDNAVSILVSDIKHNFLYTNNNLITIDRDYKKYFINAFAENDRVKFVYCPILKEIWPGTKSIDIYDVLKGLDKPAKSIEIPEKMQDNLPGELFTAPQMPGKYYVFCTEETFRGILAFTRYLCGGHAVGFAKPYLAEVEKGRISKYKEIKYGGKKNEDFFAKEIIIDAKMLHCLGFRQKHSPGKNYPPRNSPVILYYAGCDLKKKKVTQNHNVHEINCDPGSYDFGPLSMAYKDDEVFIVFSFHKYPFRGAPQNDIKQITSDIYYFQYSDKTAGDTVQIAKGFMPLVKVDSIGNVYVFWSDYDGTFVCKTKKDDKWSDEKIILADVDVLPSIIYRKYVSVEFDSENNLHIVFPSNGNIVYAKIKLDSMSDKQD